MATAEEIKEFVRQTLRLRAIDDDAAMGRVRGWDSLNHVNLVLALQETYGVEIAPDVIGELTTLAAILDHLRTNGVVSP